MLNKRNDFEIKTRMQCILVFNIAQNLLEICLINNPDFVLNWD